MSIVLYFNLRFNFTNSPNTNCSYRRPVITQGFLFYVLFASVNEYIVHTPSSIKYISDVYVNFMFDCIYKKLNLLAHAQCTFYAQGNQGVQSYVLQHNVG